MSESKTQTEAQLNKIQQEFELLQSKMTKEQLDDVSLRNELQALRRTNTGVAKYSSNNKADQHTIDLLRKDSELYKEKSKNAELQRDTLRKHIDGLQVQHKNELQNMKQKLKRDFDRELEDEKQAIHLQLEEQSKLMKKMQIKNENLQSQIKKQTAMNTKQ